MTKDRGSRKEEQFWKTVQSSKGLNNIPVFADSTWHDAWPNDTDNPPAHPDEFGTGSQSKEEMKHFCIDRHAGFIEFLFMDWSVRKVGLKELWTLKWNREFNTTNNFTTAGGMRPRDWPEWMRRYTDY